MGARLMAPPQTSSTGGPEDNGGGGTGGPDCPPVGDGEYEVRQGECVESIAFANGLSWETVWNDPKNAKVKDARKDPNVLLPGDRLHVRDLEKKQVDGATEKRHKFKRKN